MKPRTIQCPPCSDFCRLAAGGDAPVTRVAHCRTGTKPNESGAFFPLAPRSGERVPEHSEGGRGAFGSNSPLPAQRLRFAATLRHPLPQAGEGKESVLLAPSSVFAASSKGAPPEGSG